MTAYEFKQMKGALPRSAIPEGADMHVIDESVEVSNGVDWRNTAAVTPVKD